ncbi:hypothetical protein D3C71_1254540 [compost metagenome]
MGAVDQQRDHRVLRVGIDRQRRALEQPQRPHHTQNAHQDAQEMATGQAQAFLHRLQRGQASQHQQVLAERQGHHQPDTRQEIQRQAEQDQQRIDRRQQCEAWPQVGRPRQQVAVAWRFATATGVEKQDQRGGVQRIDQQTDDHADTGETVRLGGVVDHLLQQGLDDHQRQAQLHDLAQIALEEIQGVTQHI